MYKDRIEYLETKLKEKSICKSEAEELVAHYFYESTQRTNAKLLDGLNEMEVINPIYRG